MAKKKRKKRRPDRPPARAAAATTTAGPRPEQAERSTSARAERKELARRERERRIKQARRRQRTRRAIRWGVVLGVAAAIGTFVYIQVQQNREVQERAAAAARAMGCGDIQTLQNEVDAAAALDQQTLHSPPFAEGAGGVPVTAGRHSSTLQTPPFVYDQPVPEANVVHNLEHGYVLAYYAEDGPNALSDEVRSALADFVEDEGNKIIMAPYPDLTDPVALVAWGKLQTCDPPENADPDDAVQVARGFIERFRSGGLAPEPAGA